MINGALITVSGTLLARSAMLLRSVLAFGTLCGLTPAKQGGADPSARAVGAAIPTRPAHRHC
jgi:hypothetical protein